MSISTPDPSRGFVALPLEILDIEMSPGAFRTLTEFCRMADIDGYCWPSLEQLSGRLGRSRAAISGYVKELRALALLTTQEQRTANGYNYRLKYRVTFWKTWRAAFGKPARSSAAPVERSVKPAERPDSKNQSHENHAPSQVDGTGYEDLHRAWKIHVGRAPFPTLDSQPSAGLVARTRCAIDQGPAEAPASAEDALAAVSGVLVRKNIHPDPEWCSAVAAMLRAAPCPPTALKQALIAAWKPHWGRLPSATFMEKLVQRVARAHPEAALKKVLSGYLRRYERTRRDLPFAA